MVKGDKQAGKRLGVFNGLVLAANALFIAALLLAYLSVHVNPNHSWILPFFGLLFPLVAIINLFFIAYWMIRRRWLFVLSLATILLGWNHFARTTELRRPIVKPDGVSAFKVLTYNVKNLSNDNVDLLDTVVRNNILNYLDEEAPDILCLQEFSVVHSNPEDFIDSLSTVLNMPYHAYSLYTEKIRKRIDAIYIFSKYPVIGFSSLRKDTLHNYALFADMIINKDTVRVYNIHLESLRLRHEDYEFISDLNMPFEESDNMRESSKRIIHKIRTAFEKRSSQVDSLAACLRLSPYPVILCGDFNDTPNSYAYQVLTKDLEDAFCESGSGFGNTYAGKLPSNRIDYILYSGYFRSWDCRRDRVPYSDHYPVSCELSIRNSE
jgi:endonuclease/exonuclease/phosphatase family metal-dependent hydrolase